MEAMTSFQVNYINCYSSVFSGRRHYYIWKVNTSTRLETQHDYDCKCKTAETVLEPSSCITHYLWSILPGYLSSEKTLKGRRRREAPPSSDITLVEAHRRHTQFITFSLLLNATFEVYCSLPFCKYQSRPRTGGVWIRTHSKMNR